VIVHRETVSHVATWSFAYTGAVEAGVQGAVNVRFRINDFADGGEFL
jgi:hypothetical protein